MNQPDFLKWPSIQRLSSEEVIITEKIDGTNSIIHVAEDGTVTAGSRNRWLTLEADNFGFCKWVTENADALRHLGPGYHYGEWYGPGIQRGYGTDQRRFALFSHWMDPIPEVCQKVPVLYRGEWYPALFDEVVNQLASSGSVLVPGFMDPEGVVIQFKNERNAKFKKFCKNDKLHKHMIPH